MLTKEKNKIIKLIEKCLQENQESHQTLIAQLDLILREFDTLEKISFLKNEFEIDITDFNFDKLVDKFEYLYPENKEFFAFTNKLIWNTSFSNELSRILAYFIYRHCSESFDYEEFRANLFFSIICTGLISTLSFDNLINDVARIISEEIEYSDENTEIIKSLFY